MTRSNVFLQTAVIVGAGSSSSTPKISCIVASPVSCATCKEAAENPTSMNHRLNPCFLLQFRVGDPILQNSDDDTLIVKQSNKLKQSSCTPTFNVLVDCGKTFRESALKVFPSHQVKELRAVLLTHDHADACFGLDDLREFSHPGRPVTVYCDAKTNARMQSVFPYLCPPVVSCSAQRGDTQSQLYVASIAWKEMEANSLLRIQLGKDLFYDCFVIAVEHGPGYLCNAFLFPLPPAAGDDKMKYIFYASDISSFSQEQWFQVQERYLRPNNGSITILILDMLSTSPYISHFCSRQAVDCALMIGASATYFVGLSHSMEYGVTQKWLREQCSGNMNVGFDGCVVFDRDHR